MELRALNTQQSLLYGALQACDFGTQSSYLQTYLERVDAVVAAVVRLRAFVARHSDGMFVSGSSETTAEQIE